MVVPPWVAPEQLRSIKQNHNCHALLTGDLVLQAGKAGGLLKNSQDVFATTCNESAFDGGAAIDETLTSHVSQPHSARARDHRSKPY